MSAGFQPVMRVHSAPTSCHDKTQCAHTALSVYYYCVFRRYFIRRHARTSRHHGSCRLTPSPRPLYSAHHWPTIACKSHRRAPAHLCINRRLFSNAESSTLLSHVSRTATARTGHMRKLHWRLWARYMSCALCPVPCVLCPVPCAPLSTSIVLHRALSKFGH